MTVATGLTAVAAIASAVAAFRQETATFTSNLYSKQVDAVSAVLTEFAIAGMKLSALDEQVSESPNHTQVPQSSVDPLSSGVTPLPKDAGLTEFMNSNKDLAPRLTAVEVIVPDHVGSKAGDIAEDLLDAQKLLRGAFGSSSTKEGLERFRSRLRSFGNDVDVLRTCTSEQFQEGYPLRDRAFSACASREALKRS